MRLIFLVALLLNIFPSAAQAEERIALVVGNPAFAGSPRVADAGINVFVLVPSHRGVATGSRERPREGT